MFFTCLRAAEYILLSFLPSLVCSFVFSGASGILSDIISLGAFLLMAVGIFYLGYILMSTIGNKHAYVQISGTAFGIYALISAIVCITLGTEGSTLLTRGLTFLMPLGATVELSVLFSLLLLAVIMVMPGFVFVKNLSLRIYFFRRFYKDAESRYRHSRRRHSSHKPASKPAVEPVAEKPITVEEAEEADSKVHKSHKHTSAHEEDSPPTQAEMEAWLEHERKRREYEKRFTIVKPAKFTAKNDEEEDEQTRIRRKAEEKEARLQQYFTVANKKTHAPVDREEQLKNARELAEELNKRSYHSHYKRHSHHDAAEVDKEAELKKAHDLQLQLEYEEEQKLKQLFGK